MAPQLSRFGQWTSNSKFSVAASGVLAEHRDHAGCLLPHRNAPAGDAGAIQTIFHMNAAPLPPSSPKSGLRLTFAHPLAWVVLVLSLGASTGGWFIARTHEQLTARKRFDEEAARIQMTLAERLSVYQDVLHGGVGLFAASYSVEREEWRAYVSAVSVNKRFPGMDGLGFMAYVPRSQLDAFLQTTRADKNPDFQPKGLGTNDDFFIVKYLEPEADHAALLGVDLGADPVRRRVAEEARDSGSAAISSRLDLHVADDGTQAGLLMMLPVFRNGAPTATLDERRANIEGWVFARFVISQLMREIFHNQKPPVHLEVFDCTMPGRKTVVYDSDPPADGRAPAYQSRFSVTDSMPIGLRQWQLVFNTKPDFDATIPHGAVKMMAVSGAVISLLLFGIALSLSETRKRAEKMAGDMTAAYRETNATLQKEILDRQRSERRAVIQHAVTRVLADAESLNEATPKIIEAICQSLGWELGALWQVDPWLKRLRCLEIWHRPGLAVAEFESVSREKTFRPGEGLPGRVWATTQPAWIADVARDRNFPRGPVAVKGGLHAAFGFPILLGDEFHGMAEFFSREIIEPDADILTLVAALGSQIGQFIERKRAQQELQHEQFLLLTLMENIPDRVYFKDRQSRFLRVNKSLLVRHGYASSEIIGKTDFDLFTEEHARQAFEDEQRLISGGQPMTKEEKETWADGRVSWALTTKMPLRDEAGNIVGTFGISRDISALKLAQQQLQHEQFLLNTLMEYLPDRIYFKDLQSRFVRNSRAHLDRFGLKHASDAMGKTDADFFTEEHARQAFEDEQQLIRSGGQITKEEKETWPDGSVTWALSTKMVLRDETGKVVGTFGISRDITDRKRAEEAMREARDAAEEANRAKSQFLANMSHELRTPLNSVIGFAGILLKNKPGNLNPADLNFLERIQANGKNLLVLINEILDLSKIEARKVELQLAPVALDVLIRDTIIQQEGLVRDRPVKLTADLPATIASIQADADKLRQVIINLIGNALKFTERGSVTVSVITDPADHRPVRIDVTDTGIGIPQEKLAVIFEAFQQADASTARKYGGTGLGLTISQALCRLMGFRIEVKSETDRGSTFSVILAGKEKTVMPPRPGGFAPGQTGKLSVSAARLPSDLHGKLVLVIDDESDSRLLLTNLLEEFGCQVIAADSGEQGLSMAREFQPQLITVDLLMPQMDGASVIRALKADPQLRAIPLVVVSIVAKERRGSILGAVDLLEKPVVREDLLAMLRRHLLPARAKILIVDDAEDARQILLKLLADEPVESRTAANGREALALMETFPPDLVLLDLIMPVMNGVEYLAAIRADQRYLELPVVIVTSKELTPEEREMFQQQQLEVVNKSELTAENFKLVLQRILNLAGIARKPGLP